MRKLLEFATLLGATALLLVACGSDEAEEAPVPAAQMDTSPQSGQDHARREREILESEKWMREFLGKNE